ncbi:hypothetical protein N657DRAFT_649631 [Parathielavia appendiculata]|uniref:Uncharacterized protein n=1 Tax=Parathielavia appendiculata TaxID=2587402 RepID=A0AAN6TSV4_9PEZI|nr:hypothetical protein N657DRAFT_649631 [Parathielavia appendiculata]
MGRKGRDAGRALAMQEINARESGARASKASAYLDGSCRHKASCDGHHPRSGQLAHTRSILLQREQELDDRNGRSTRP